ncbi:unnamed protein product [Rotaria sp. Silwood1]|nr:unnamed protein product [Rotaria sp. Silwood1]
MHLYSHTSGTIDRSDNLYLTVQQNSEVTCQHEMDPYEDENCLFRICSYPSNNKIMNKTKVLIFNQYFQYNDLTKPSYHHYRQYHILIA